MNDLDLSEIRSLRSYRDKNFDCKISRSFHTIFPGEQVLSVTHNGSHWTSILVLPNEIDKIIEVLQKAKESR